MSGYEKMDCGRQIRGDHGQLFTCEGTIEVRVPVYFDVLYKQNEPHKLALNGIGTHEDSVEIVANCSDCGAAPARVMYPPIFRAVEAMASKPETPLRRPRIDVITYVDSDGNPDTTTFVNGAQTDALLPHKHPPPHHRRRPFWRGPRLGLLDVLRRDQPQLPPEGPRRVHRGPGGLQPPLQGRVRILRELRR